MPGQLTPLVQKDFSGGLNLSVNPYLIPRKQLWRVRNLILDEQGALRTRPGSSIHLSTTGVTNPIRLYRSLNLSSGTNKKYGIAHDGATATIYDLDTSPYTSKSTYNSTYLTPQAVTVLDKDVIAPGYVVPKIYDGTTVSDMTAQAGQTVPPGAKHIALHLGSLWVWNTNATTTTLDGPSALRMAAAAKVDDWPNANQAFVAKDDGQVGMGCAAYTIVETGISPISTLVLFKNFSAYQVTGVFGASNFAVQQVKTDMGCVAPRTIQFVSGFGIIRLTHKGFALYNGVDDKLLSEEIRPAIFGNEGEEGDILPLDFSKVDLAYAGQVQNPPLYVCAAPVEGSNGLLSRFFIFDLIRKAWTICDFPYSLTWLGTIYIGSTGDLYAGSSSDGTIYRLMGLDDFDDNGTKIDWSLRTGPIASNDPTGNMYFRRVAFDMVYPQGQDMNFNIHLNGYTTELTGTRSLPLLVTSGRTDVDIMRKAPSIYATISGSGNIRLRAITWQVRQTPLSKVRL